MQIGDSTALASLDPPFAVGGQVLTYSVSLCRGNEIKPENPIANGQEVSHAKLQCIKHTFLFSLILERLKLRYNFWYPCIVMYNKATIQFCD